MDQNQDEAKRGIARGEVTYPIKRPLMTFEVFEVSGKILARRVRNGLCIFSQRGKRSGRIMLHGIRCALVPIIMSDQVIPESKERMIVVYIREDNHAVLELLGAGVLALIPLPSGETLTCERYD